MKRVNLLFCALISSIVLASCAAKELRVKEYEVATGVPNPAKAPDEFYLIGPGDSLGVVLWKEPSLSGSVRVRPDGYITLPLVNEVQVSGITTAELRKLLEEKYKEFVASPFVSIRIEGINSSEIFLIGHVNKPGAYPLNGNDSLLQVLTRAGGLSIFADRDNIRIVRRQAERIIEYIVDYDAIIKGDLKQDILLRPGDRIIVP